MVSGSEMVRRADKRQEWERHLDEWTRSSQSQVSYCREHGLSYSLFSYWKRRIKQKTSPEIKLVPIGLPQALLSPICTSSALRLVINAHHHVEVMPGFDGPTLKRLIEVLEQA